MRDEDGASTITNNKHHEDGVRLNKCIPSMSRRSADDAIQKGSVTVNGEVMRNPGHRVTFKDVVKLDGEPQKWQEGALAKRNSISSQRVHEERNFIYLKYWKPRGVTCTADPADPTNIIAAGGFQLFPQRVFTVGRLDKDSTGLILLTSDGRLNHALLGTKFEASPPSIASDTPSAAGAGAIVGSVKEKVYVFCSMFFLPSLSCLWSLSLCLSVSLSLCLSVSLSLCLSLPLSFTRTNHPANPI